MAKRILVPLDDHTDPVLPLVGSFARGSGAVVRLLRVMDLPSSVEAVTGGGEALMRAVERRRADAEADLATAGAAFDGIPVDTAIRFGDPAVATALEAQSFGADLVAVSTSASRLDSFFTPRVGDAVAWQCSLPLLEVRIDDRRH